MKSNDLATCSKGFFSIPRFNCSQSCDYVLPFSILSTRDEDSLPLLLLLGTYSTAWGWRGCLRKQDAQGTKGKGHPVLPQFLFWEIQGEAPFWRKADWSWSIWSLLYRGADGCRGISCRWNCSGVEVWFRARCIVWGKEMVGFEVMSVTYQLGGTKIVSSLDYSLYYW